MRWQGIAWVLVTATLATGALVAVEPSATAGSSEVEIVARKTAETPRIDGKVDKVWDTVKAVRVKATEGPQGPVEVTLKALYSERDIYFLVQWPDKTMSMNRFFEFDGKEWKKVKGYEDRINFAWDIHNTVKDFPSRSCAAACHREGKEVSWKTTSAAERLDVWHWKAPTATKHIQRRVAESAEKK